MSLTDVLRQEYVRDRPIVVLFVLRRHVAELPLVRALEPWHVVAYKVKSVRRDDVWHCIVTDDVPNIVKRPHVRGDRAARVFPLADIATLVVPRPVRRAFAQRVEAVHQCLCNAAAALCRTDPLALWYEMHLTTALVHALLVHGFGVLRKHSLVTFDKTVCAHTERPRLGRAHMGPIADIVVAWPLLRCEVKSWPERGMGRVCVPAMLHTDVRKLRDHAADVLLVAIADVWHTQVATLLHADDGLVVQEYAVPATDRHVFIVYRAAPESRDT